MMSTARTALLSVLAFVTACTPTSNPRPPIVVPASLAGQEVAVRADVNAACALIRAFAARHGWADLVGGCFYDRVEVFDSAAQLKERVRVIHDLEPDARLPDGVVAGLEKRILLAVTAEEDRRLNPEYTRQPDSWRRLLAHEMAHRLHVAILDGDEDAMGPTWFFEGFAVFASGQELGDPLVYSTAEEALEGVHAKGPLAYRRYGAALKFFAGRIPLTQLVVRAGAEGFEEWLIEEAR